MKKHDACIENYHGWVEVNDDDYRAINCVTHKLHNDILNSKFYKEKEDIYWPKVSLLKAETEDKKITKYETDYLHHIVRYPEFSPKQFKEALLFLTDVCMYCEKNGYYIRTHLWNVTYRNGFPFIIDIRDFEKLSNKSWTSIFKGHFLKKISNHCPVLPNKFVKNSDYIINKFENCDGSLFSIRDILNEIIIVKNENDRWSRYHSDRTLFLHDYSFLNESLYNKIKNYSGGSGDKRKSFNLLSLIEKYKPKTITEIGCNNGLYCFAMSKFSNVVGLDYDRVSIDEANKINETLKRPCNFAFCDILDNKSNSASYGINGSYGNKYDRFKSEMVVAPAVIHHLFTACKNLDLIINILTKFSIRYMIIEHIPNIYDQNIFEKTLKKYKWSTSKIVDSSPSPRKYYVLEKK